MNTTQIFFDPVSIITELRGEGNTTQLQFAEQHNIDPLEITGTQSQMLSEGFLTENHTHSQYLNVEQVESNIFTPEQIDTLVGYLGVPKSYYDLTDKPDLSLKANLTDLLPIAEAVETNRLALLNKAEIQTVATLITLVGTKADQSYVNDQIATLVGTDGQVLSTIQSIANELANAEGLLEALDQTVANRVRFDVATQALTTLQKYNARTNIGAEEIGEAARLIALITIQSLGGATAAQGVKADTAVQPNSLATVATSGSYADLTGKPTIPSKTSDLSNDSGFISSLASALIQIAGLSPADNDILQRKSGSWVNRTITQLKVDLGLSTVATSGSYVDLTGKPTIPSKTSDLSNDSGFISSLASALIQIAGLSPADNDILQRKSGSWVNRTITQLKVDLGLSTVATSGSYVDLTGKPTIPSKTSDLSNDSGFISSLASALIQIAGLSPADNDILQRKSGSWVNRTITQLKVDLGLSTVATSGSYVDLTGKPTIPSKTSDLSNDSGFISSLASALIQIAGLSPADNDILQRKSGSWVNRTITQLKVDLGLSTVATSGSYVDLTGKPTIPSKTSDLSNDSGFISSLASALIQIAGLNPADNDILQRKSGSWINRTVAQLKIDLGLSTVATSGSYADLTGKPTIPTTTDGLAEGTTNLYYTATRVRTLALTGLTFATAVAITATDGLVAALGKLQAQLNNIILDISNINLRGQDLVSNGLGQLKNNKYFSTFTFDPLDRPAGVGSFTGASGMTSGVGDELIPVDPTRYYKLSYFIRQKTAGIVANAFGYINPFDADGYGISPFHYMARPSTLTTLAADLKAGDTIMQLTSAANWIVVAGSTQPHNRSAIFWNYVDGSGYLWPENTYSRNWSGADLYNDGGISGNTITLRVPWSGATIPAGTKLSNGSAGGSYMYIGIGGTATPEVWTNYSGVFGTTHPSATLNAATTKLPISTAYIKVGFLFNRNPTTSGYLAGSQTGVAGISIRDWSAAYDPSLLKNTVLQTVDTSPTKLVTTNSAGDIKSINITVDANGFIKKA